MIDWSAFWSQTDRVMLAPMEGVVDSIIRDLLTRDPRAIDLCVTEFIRVTDRLLPDHEFYKDCPELHTGGRTATGVPVLVQLLGGQPGPLAENAARAVELGALGIDLNFGCPAKTVNRHDGGATLLKNPSRLFDVLSAVRAAVPKEFPVSAKVRLGFSDKTFHLDIAQAAESGGAAWLAVHARTRDEGYRPPAHWEFIARMREVVSIPVIANGEIWTADDYARAREVSGCRHAMIGRGLLANPDLAHDVKGLGLKRGWPAMVRTLEEFAAMSLAARNENYAVCRMKQWLRNLGRTYPQAVATFEVVKRLEDLAPMLQVLTESVKNVSDLNFCEQTPSASTTLSEQAMSPGHLTIYESSAQVHNESVLV